MEDPRSRFVIKSKMEKDHGTGLLFDSKKKTHQRNLMQGLSRDFSQSSVRFGKMSKCRHDFGLWFSHALSGPCPATVGTYGWVAGVYKPLHSHIHSTTPEVLASTL